MPVRTLERQISLPAAEEHREPMRAFRPSLLEVAAAVQGLALVVLVATEGSASARLLRIAPSPLAPPRPVPDTVTRASQWRPAALVRQHPAPDAAPEAVTAHHDDTENRS